jgi:predicted lipoprotein with Yx(FWY)xxD motif
LQSLVRAAVLAAAILLLTAAQAMTATTTIGQLAPTTNPQYVPPYYYYDPPQALCSTPEDLLQPSVSSGLAYVVPANGETITSWSTTASSGSGQEMTMKVFREKSAGTYEVVGHDGPESLTPGSTGTSTTGVVSTFPASIPVQPGDVIGLFSNNANSVNSACMFPVGGSSYLHSGSSTGLSDTESTAFSSAPGYRLNVRATVQLAQPSGGPTQYTLTVNTSGAGTGTVQSSPAGIEACSGSCSQAFDEGTGVTLTATPGAYSTFTGWSGGGCSGTGTCHVTVGGDTAVTAAFAYSYSYGEGGYGTGGGGYGGGGSGGGESTPTAQKCKKVKRHGKLVCKTKRVARTAQSPQLGKTVLVSLKGRTLYSLSAETHGKFICTKASGCLSAWHPLTVPTGVVPVGPVKLGTVKRPEGGVQVTYRGLPLYTFAGDTGPGQANGQGLQDVGTWGAAAVPKAKR